MSRASGQVVGKLRPDRLEAPRAIGLQKVDHHTAAGAALAVDVLEEVEREGPRTVE
jgi:hypothetical protein